MATVRPAVGHERTGYRLDSAIPGSVTLQRDTLTGCKPFSGEFSIQLDPRVKERCSGGHRGFSGLGQPQTSSLPVLDQYIL